MNNIMTADDNDGSDIDVNLNSTYVCQMKLFAMIRKPQPERRSYKLSPMYKDIVGMDKLSSSENGWWLLETHEIKCMRGMVPLIFIFFIRSIYF